MVKVSNFKGLLWTLFALLTPTIYAQNFVLSGIVKDSLSNEFLIGATIQIDGTTQGVSTNAYGYYALSLPQGRYNLSIRYVGYAVLVKQIEIKDNRAMDFLLNPINSNLQEMVVAGRKGNEKILKAEMSVEKLSAKIIKQVPAVFGEADVIKSIQLLPGVTTPNEGSGGFNVRGGAADQNLVLLDEAIVYNSAHLLGFFSVFNADAIKDVTLYKGGIPAQYGGRLSSVLDVRMNEGNQKKFAMSGGIGLLSSRMTLETPFGKTQEGDYKGSLLLSGRRSYADIFLPLVPDTAINRNKLYFYDFNFRSNYRLSAKDKVYLSGYFGRDKIDVPNGFGNTYGNTTATFRWNHLFGARLFANTSAIYSNYDYQITFYPGTSFKWNSALSNINLKSDFNFFINNDNTLKTGLGTIVYRFNPGNIEPLGNSSTLINRTNYRAKNAIENYFYVQYEQKIREKLTLNYGVRISHFAQLALDSVPQYANNNPLVFNKARNIYEKGTVETHVKYPKNEWLNNEYNIEPRINLNYTINDRMAIKASYNRTAQYIHLLSSSTSPTPLDIYTPSSPYIKPQTADQVAMGYFQNFEDNAYELSAEAYYKKMRNQFDFIDGASLLFNNSPETIILNGEARAYGLELMLKKSIGRLSGWVSYTLSKSERTTQGVNNGTAINNGNYYPTNYDKPHNLAITSTYELTKRWRISANFIFQSGRPITYPVSKYTFNGISVPEYSQRNEYRLPTYHRLDISATFIGKQTKRLKGQWVLGLYNAYNRYNAASISFKEELVGKTEIGLGTGINKAYKLTYFGIVPSVSYDFKF